jgi:hypothetical protein
MAFISHSSGGRKSRLKAQANLISGEGLLLIVGVSFLCPHMIHKFCANSLRHLL